MREVRRGLPAGLSHQLGGKEKQFCTCRAAQA